MSRAKGIGVASLGVIEVSRQRCWESALGPVRFFDIGHVAESGTRLASRVLGIGVDSARLAAKTALSARRILCLNPWPAYALATAGRRDIACTGIYSVPGSRAWTRLLASLGRIPVVAFSQSEAAAWIGGGGRARAVKWGNTFGLPLSQAPDDVVRIFVGGTSDRDQAAVAGLAAEVTESASAVELVLADGTGPRIETTPRGSTIRRLPYVSQHEFLSWLSSCHVAYLPLKDNGRAAGHMVMAACREAGLPILVTAVAGVREYLDDGAQAWPSRGLALRRLMEMARADDAEREALRKIWQSEFSAAACTRSVAEALTEMSWIKARDERVAG